LIIVWVTVLILRAYARLERKRIGEERPLAVVPDADLKELIGQE
jgi:hypothetical protein